MRLRGKETLNPGGWAGLRARTSEHTRVTMPRPRWTHKLSLPASLFVVTAVLYWRRPDAFLEPQFWAEDGAIFFRQAYLEGARAIGLTYSGYYHLVPRLVAWFAEVAPYRFAPAIYNLAGLGSMWAVVVMLHSSRLRLPAPLAYSLALVLVPHFTGEVFVNLTNVQWPLALLLLLTVLQAQPERPFHILVDIGIIVLVGLSTPLVALVVPILLLRAILDRSWRWGAEAGSALLVAGMQILAFRRNPTSMPPSPNHEPWSWIELLGQKLIGTFFLGRHEPYEHPPLLLLVLGGLLGIFLTWRLLMTGFLGKQFALPSLAFGLAATAAAFYKFRYAADLLVPPAAAIRYFYLPWVTCCWALITLVMKDRPWVKVPAVLLLLVILHSSLTTVFRSPPLRDFQWQNYEAGLEAREHLRIPINPPGWKMEVNEPPPEAAPPSSQ